MEIKKMFPHGKKNQVLLSLLWGPNIPNIWSPQHRVYLDHTHTHINSNQVHYYFSILFSIILVFY